MASLERNCQILMKLVRLPHNNLCADCGAPGPDWASYTLGVFLCLNCSGMHRNIPNVSKVKSIHLDLWEDSLVEAMQKAGNHAAKAIYEKCVPAFFYRPQHRDCVVLKQQWICAKYERREFTGENNSSVQVYNSDVFQSVLWKKGRDNKRFLKRSFVLLRKDLTLRYFVKEDSPKAVISMKDLNAVFQPEKIGHAHGLQISYLHGQQTRNLFVYHENGQLIVSWFNAIRAARLDYLQRKHPTLRVADLLPRITRLHLMEGYMEKTGPTQREPFKKRWFTLCSVSRKLLYYKCQLDATELNAVFIGTENYGYSVSELSSRGSRGGHWGFGISLQTPERQYVFMCEEEPEQKEWLEAFTRVIAQPMTPEDYANEANLSRGK
ncbi:arf-GAP with dual PH domain-containing protein 2-like [Synchiropus splendidus]|uniref:arf-GAP with dual PH domain-containing protein 2-like n=1 Tax=Synchiropus splendidus TaxID=270530 RepID=UPI00237EB8C5|nr:arf-GAP with dual PH domain-containing protein 2-like [Synchiropus splendidus]